MTERNSDRPVAVELPVRHWVALLALLDRTIATRFTPEVERLMDEGKTEQDLSPAEITALFAPLVARAAIVDKLFELGEIAPEARDRVGTPFLERWMDGLDAHKPRP
jgi:hypothetical protein